MTRASGKLWSLGRHRLLCGDAESVEDADRLLGEERPALVLADPPYFRKVVAAWDNTGSFDDWLAGTDRAVLVWSSRLLARGTLAWWCAPDHSWHVEGILRRRMLMLNHICWDKGSRGLPHRQSAAALRRWYPASERLLIAEVGQPDLARNNFMTQTRHIAARSAYAGLIARMAAWRRAAGLSTKAIDAHLGTNGMAGHYFCASQWSLPTESVWAQLRVLFAARGVDIGEFDAQRREFDAQRRELPVCEVGDIWHARAPRGAARWGHPTPKPLAIFGRLVLSCTRPDDLVVDPFAGSGTTLIAAEQHGRRCYAIEQSEEYCETVIARWEALTGERARRVESAARGAA